MPLPVWLELLQHLETQDPGGLGQGLEGEDGQGRFNLLEVSRKLVDHLSSITSPVPESRTFLQSISQSNLRVK